MTSLDTLLALTSFAFIAACTPGPNNIMLTASGVNFGFMRTIPHMAGVLIGFCLLLLACGFGLGALFTAYPASQTVLKIAGALYMLWLAWKVASAAGPEANQEGATKPLTFLQAAVFQWINPKGVLIGLSAIALFVRPETVLFDLAVVILVFGVATVVAIVTWTWLGTVLASALRNPRHARIFNLAMALALVASLYPVLLPAG